MRDVKTGDSYKEKAKAAISKGAAYGEDIDLDSFQKEAEPGRYQDDPSQLSDNDKARMLDTGVSLDDLSQRSGTFIQIDNAPALGVWTGTVMYPPAGPKPSGRES